MPLVYTPDLLFEGFSLSRVVLLDSLGNEDPDGEIYGARSANWEPEIESFDEFSHDKLINVWSDVRRVNFTLEAGYTSLTAWSKMTGSAVESEPLITNLLTANVASAGRALGALTGITNWDSTVTYQPTGGEGSVGAIQVVSTGGGTYFASDIPVSANQTYTAHVRVARTAGGFGGISGSFWFYDSAGTDVGHTGLSVVTGSGDWSNMVATYFAPSTAVRANVYTYPNSGQTIQISQFGLWKGSGGSWAMPGEPITGITGSPSNYVDRLPLYEHGKSNGQSFSVRLTFPAKDAQGNTQDLSLTLFKVKFKPPKSSGASYKDGQSVTYEATALLSPTDETGTVLEREAFGRIDRAYSV